MKIEAKENTLTDGSRVFDVYVHSNSSDGKKAIISCYSEADRNQFLRELEKLIEKHTCELVEFI